MRIGYAGQASASVAPGVTVGTIADTADMASGDILLETAASQYRWDVTAGFPVRQYTARSFAAADGGTRFGATLPMLGNGATYDPQLNNTRAVMLASASRSGSTSAGAQTLYNARGVTLQLELSAAPNTAETLAMWVLSAVPSTGAAWLSWASFTLPAGSTLQGGPYLFTLSIYPGGSTAADNATYHKAVYIALPGRVGVPYVQHSGASAWTYALYMTQQI